MKNNYRQLYAVKIACEENTVCIINCHFEDGEFQELAMCRESHVWHSTNTVDYMLLERNYLED